MRLIFLKAACLAAILSSPWIACSQHYYVVVGAFATTEDASEIKGYLPGALMDSSYTVTETENLLQFYVIKTSDKQTAISKTFQLRKAIEEPGTDKSSGVGKEIRLSGKPETGRSPDVQSPVLIEGSAASASSSVLGNAGNIPTPPVGKYFKFRIESPEGRPLAGNVHHVDIENGRELAVYNANTFVDLLRPGQGKKPMTVVCGMFGYKEIYKNIDYANPSATDEHAYVDPQGVWVIPYKLERVAKGDVSPMYNVSFYKDAAVMRKSSQVDLDELVKMMHSNPYYEITIHAHCNGKKKREIIALGPNKNYFDAEGSVKMTGSAKNLTEQRAQAIRTYLVSHGIDGSRIQIFAWGASDMLVKPNSPQASINDRIEIEFTRD